MATQRIKNISNTDREVPTPDGGYVIVPQGHSHEFDSEHAKSLLEQSDVWEKYKRRKTTGDEVDDPDDDEPETPMTDAEHGEAVGETPQK
jgi:hypothetical protein